MTIGLCIGRSAEPGASSREDQLTRFLARSVRLFSVLADFILVLQFELKANR